MDLFSYRRVGSAVTGELGSKPGPREKPMAAPIADSGIVTYRNTNRNQLKQEVSIDCYTSLGKLSVVAPKVHFQLNVNLLPQAWVKHSIKTST